MTETTIRILIIEDDENARTLLKEIVAGAAYVVDEAGDGASALALMKDNRYDIVLVDHTLPDMNGLELLKQSQELSHNAIPIIVTGAISLEIAMQGMMIGVHDYMIKPVAPEELLKNMSNILQEREETRKGMEHAAEILQKIKYEDEREIRVVVRQNAAHAEVSHRDEKAEPSGEGSTGAVKKLIRFFWPE